MQKIISFLVLLSAAGFLSAQPYEEKIEYDKKKQPCLAMDFNHPPLAVENAFKLKMDQLGYKGKEEKGLFNKDKGFLVYLETVIPDISPTTYDYVVSIGKKSRKSEDESVIYFLVMKNGENVLAALNTMEFGNTKAYLINMMPDIEAASLELKISALEELVSKEEKRLKGLRDDKEDLEKKIRDNEKEQDKQQKEIESQKKILEELKLKRKN